MTHRATLLLIAATGWLCASCIDPIHDDAVASLGDEAIGVAPGPLHRPGQPCTTCHGDEGPARLPLSVGGTVFLARDGTEPASGLAVTITDASGASRDLVTNEAGNFFASRDDYAPAFPLRVRVSRGEEQTRMLTRIGREGGCASCHRGAATDAQMPGVYLRTK